MMEYSLRPLYSGYNPQSSLAPLLPSDPSSDDQSYIPVLQYLSVVDAKLRTEMGAERMLAEVLEPLKSRYDYILIDTCPSLGMLTINACGIQVLRVRVGGI